MIWGLFISIIQAAQTHSLEVLSDVTRRSGVHNLAFRQVSITHIPSSSYQAVTAF
ncbi:MULTISPECIES: hypothetical protein [Acidithiobacillus]|uniref:hypothetical protein n=1 Tax=Acidithiobacillus TaxID=119977 RepID=UPI001C078F76|nr:MULTISPECIES: hypothetical protein [Acidithiobacillus]MBU2742579.1 hypothetical protein [Acidithiobacillus albertensis]